MVPFFPSCLECGGTVPAQTACLLPGAPDFTTPAHRRRPFFFAVVVAILPKSDLGRGAGSGGAVGEAWDPGIAADGAGVLAARCRSDGQKENIFTALEKLRAESCPSHRGH